MALRILKILATILIVVDVIAIMAILFSVFPLSSFNLSIGLAILFLFTTVYLTIIIWLKSISRKRTMLSLNHFQEPEIKKEVRDTFSRSLLHKPNNLRLHKEKKYTTKSHFRKDMLMEKGLGTPTNPKSILNIIILTLGFLSVTAAIIYTSSTLTFIGLGLIFWGAVLLYMTNMKYVRLDLLTAIISSMIDNIEKIIESRKLNGKGIYLPPKFIQDSETSLIFIPTKVSQNIPKLKMIKEAIFSKTLKGIFLTPLGLDLSKLFEKELQKPFRQTDLNDLQINLPKIINKLEIAENTTITIKNNIVIAEYINQIFKETCKDISNLNTGQNFIGCPLCSAFACILSKVISKPVMIEKEEQSQGGRVTTTQYRILEK